MYPPSPKPMEAATMARRGGLPVQSRPGSSWARAGTWAHGTGVGYSTTPSAARRRGLPVASIGIRESLPARSMVDEAMAVEVEEDINDPAKIGPSPDAPDAKTVRVKFVLEKECAFGQHFLVVGDDPALGLWDPAKAVALDWSEGHFWAVKMDLPANKLIEFKFLLRDASGHVLWQPGANRTLLTTETPDTLVVQEDWDHVTSQRVSEEEELLIEAEDVTLSDDLAGSAGATLSDELRTGENLESNGSPVADTSLHGEMDEANGENHLQFILEEDQNISNELHGKAELAPQNGYPSDDNARPNEGDSAMCEDDAQIANRPTTSIFENDLTWARKALQQLLRFLGFQIGTTRT